MGTAKRKSSGERKPADPRKGGKGYTTPPKLPVLPGFQGFSFRNQSADREMRSRYTLLTGGAGNGGAEPQGQTPVVPPGGVSNMSLGSGALTTTTLVEVEIGAQTTIRQEIVEAPPGASVAIHQISLRTQDDPMTSGLYWAVLDITYKVEHPGGEQETLSHPPVVFPCGG